MTDEIQAIVFTTPSGSGKSFLEKMLLLQGVSFQASAEHVDGPDDFAAASKAAHNIEECLPNLHDTVLETTGKSLSDDELRQLLASLPEEIREQIEDWGLADTEVNAQISAYLQQQG